MSAEFVHLHLHSHYSLLDGAIKLPDLVKKAVEYEMPALALTDHGNLHGAVEFYTLANKAEINPLIGCEVYVAPGSRTDKNPRADGLNYYHLVLLAETDEGYKNLIKIVSDAYINGFYYRPRTDLEVLSQRHRGLIALSACLQGEVPHTLARQGEDKAREAAGRLDDLFGHGNFIIEIQDAGIPEQHAVNPGLLKLAKELDLLAVATNDCHYLTRADAKAHDVLLAVQTGKTVDDESRMKMETDLLYFRSPAEMIEQFKFQPQLCRNTLAVAERCHVAMDLKSHHFPGYPFLKGRDVEEVLREQAEAGLKMRLVKAGIREEEAGKYWDRLEYELGVIVQMGFAAYFLVVSEFITWAKEQGIPVGPGRGSAAGSAVAWAMKITDLDPIKYGLLFERFLNVERISMPDIDVDFCFLKRDKVIEHVTELYGADRVAQITTYGSLKAKAVIRDVGRALGMPYGEVDRIAKLVPDVLKMTLKKAQQEEPRLKDLRTSDPRVDELISLAERLEGLNRHAGTHAAGVVIAPGPLTDYLPLYQDQSGKTVTQFDMKCTEKVGLIKFDFLGLRTLTVIDTACRLIRETLAPEFDIEFIPMDDQETFSLLARGETTGVFQLESSGMKDLLIKFKPSVFEDIIALVALYRPGPMSLIPDYIERKFGRKPVEYPHPSLEPILKETYGIIVYQEQVMAIANTLAGYSLGQADILRRAMGKKIVEVMNQERPKFIEGARAREVDEATAGKIYDLILEFANYGFNKSHAAAYGLIAYQTAYLKAHFPVQFMAAQLTSWSGNSDQIMVHFAECREHGIHVLPPDVNASGKDFGVDGQAIRFGLAAVKNVGQGAVEAILEAREDGGPYISIFDFCDRVDSRRVNKRVLESLIKCGAFDTLEGHRAQLMAVMDQALEQGSRSQKEREEGQMGLFDAAPETAAPFTPRLPDSPQWAETVRLSYEKEALGFYVSGHPLADVEHDLRLFTTVNVAGLNGYSDGAKVRVGGMTAHKKEINSKKGERMAFIQLEDLSGSVEVVCFPKIFAENRALLESEEPILISGKLNRNETSLAVVADEIVPLSQAAEKMQKELALKLNLDKTGPETLASLKSILTRHQGQAPVYLHLERPGRFVTVIEADQKYHVKPSQDLLDQVRQLLGQ